MQDQRVAVVTGSSSGIGIETSHIGQKRLLYICNDAKVGRGKI